MRDYNNKVAVVTGSADGIGKAIAEECTRRNMKVIIADINEKKLIALEKQLKLHNKNILAVKTDVSKEADIINLLNQTLSKFKKVHFLFNNAAIAGPVAPIWETNISDLKHVMDCNYMGVVYALRNFIPVMLQQNDECHIVNTGSGTGFCTEPYSSCYGVSKHALVELTEVLFLDLKEKNANIHVSLFTPGVTNTNFANTVTYKDSDSEQIKNLVDSFKDWMKEKGENPSSVVDKLFAGIENNQFYIFTHFEKHKVLIEKRMNNILMRKNPE